MNLRRPSPSLLRALLFVTALAATTPTSSFAQSATTCEVCIPPDYAAACVEAREVAKANRRAADVCEGARSGSEGAHGAALRDLGKAHEEIGALKHARDSQAAPWVVFLGGAATGIGAALVVMILAR
jgi:hypothetical protein